MTTKFDLQRNIILFFTVAVFCLFNFNPFITKAQDFETITSSTDLSTSTANVENSITSEAWYRSEKLIGDNVKQGDFVIGPGRIEIQGNPGETIVKEISVTNRIGDDQSFEITVEDIEGSQELDSAVVLLGEKTGKYTLKDYVSFKAKKFNLDLGERAWIPITITIPQNAEPGGLYASVLISTTNKDNEVESMAKSPVIARIGTLLFVTIPGNIEKAGVLKDVNFSNNKWWYGSGPIRFNLLFDNTGSVHLNPYGEIRVNNFLGEEVGFLEIEPWFVLPKSLRTREVVWDREFLFGRYTATFFINRGYDDVVDSKTISFWVVPWKIIVGTFLVIFFIVFVVTFFLRNFELKKKK